MPSLRMRSHDSHSRIIEPSVPMPLSEMREEPYQVPRSSLISSDFFGVRRVKLPLTSMLPRSGLPSRVRSVTGNEDLSNGSLRNSTRASRGSISMASVSMATADDAANAGAAASAASSASAAALFPVARIATGKDLAQRGVVAPQRAVVAAADVRP